MTMSEYFDEYICWKAEILGVSRHDEILVAEYVRIEIVAAELADLRSLFSVVAALASGVIQYSEERGLLNGNN